MIKLNLTDNDVRFNDDISNDVTISKEMISEPISVGDTVTIHYYEDEHSITHEYCVSDITEDTVQLDWIGMHNTQDKLLEDDENSLMPKKMQKGLKRAEKAQKKLDKKAVNIFARDLELGKDHKYYLELPDKTHIKAPLSYNDVLPMYKENPMSPAIVNAIVISPYDVLVRAGKEDKLNNPKHARDVSAVKVLDSYRDEWTDDSIKYFKTNILKKYPAISKLVKATITKKTSDSADKKKSKTSTSDKPAEKSEQKGITAAVMKKLEILTKLTGIKVLDTDAETVIPNPSRIAPDQVSNYWIKVHNKETELDKWLNDALKVNLLTESCDLMKMLREGTLLESPVIKLSDDELTDPADINLKKVAQKAVEKEAEANRAAKLSQQIAELHSKYEDVPNKLTTSLNGAHTYVETLDVLFSILVPSSGIADSLAGELVRATMRILYRDANDGDKFFEGYGIETCGSSAEFLFDNGFAEEIQEILDSAHRLAEDDDAYTDAITLLTEHVVKHISNNTDLIYTPNDTDSRDYPVDYIVENQPTYEFELYGSDAVDTLVDKGILDSWKLISYVENQLEYESAYRDAEVARPWSHHDTSVTVTNLTRDGYELLKSNFEHNPEGWWEDLTSEYADDLADSDYDDDFDSSEED